VINKPSSQTPHAGEDRNHSPASDTNERPGQQIHPGTGSGEAIKGDGGGGSGDDTPVNVDAGLQCFSQNNRTRLKATSIKEYSIHFRHLADEIEMEKYSKRQLSGKIGKTLILKALEDIPRPSWRKNLAMYKVVWTTGFNLPWPIDNKRDIGRLPKTQRSETPPDTTIIAWNNGLRNETDPYLSLFWRAVFQPGWRPSHVARMKWRNVRYDAQGKPYAIVADGAQEDFKTNAPVAFRLPPDMVEALEAWRKVAPESFPEKPILPWRSTKGKVKPDKELNLGQFHELWDGLKAKWGLPPLRPRDCRHWVATACRKAGLSKQATAYLMGHDPTTGGAMRDWYDNPQLADIFDEQAGCLPKGPLGLLEPPELKIVSGMPPEALGLLRDYLDGRCGTMEFATRMEGIRARQTKLAQVLEP